MTVRKMLLILILPVMIYGQNALYSRKDVEICNSKFQLAVGKDLFDKPINEVVEKIGRSFLGVDYEAHTYEKGDKEQVVINLTGLDCTTFMVNTLAMSRCVKEGDTSFAAYVVEVRQLLYREGKVEGYPSRIHYTSDWIYENVKNAVIEDVTEELGGKEIQFDVSFMSTHPDSYKRLKNKPEYIPIIAEQEKAINERTYHYIPEGEIEPAVSKIKSGDIIGLTTGIDGLDIGHVGFAVKESDGRIHFMHAPQLGAKVQISEKPLPDYVKAIDKHTGIIVLRPLEP